MKRITQIFIRFTNDKGEQDLIGREYGNLYGEKLIGQMNHIIQWLMKNQDFPQKIKEDITSIMDVDFDHQEILKGEDMISQTNTIYKDCKCLETYLLHNRHCTEKRVLIDLKEDKKIAYALLDLSDYFQNPMSLCSYIRICRGDNWILANKDWTEKEIQICYRNIQSITQTAKEMTVDEVSEFLHCQYNAIYDTKPSTIYESFQFCNEMAAGFMFGYMTAMSETREKCKKYALERHNEKIPFSHVNRLCEYNVEMLRDDIGDEELLKKAKLHTRIGLENIPMGPEFLKKQNQYGGVD